MSTYVAPHRPQPYGPILTVAPPPDPEKEQDVLLPNDVQMLNAMRRIHVEGYQRALQRHGGIFEAPDDTSLIFDPRSLRDGQFQVRIDDLSLSVWTGRYVRHFVAQTDDHHERAIRAVIADLHNSDEARQKRGETGGGGGGGSLRGPISVSGRDFEVPQ